MRICVIIPAAGASKRFSEAGDTDLIAPRSKLDEDLGGRPVLQRTVELFTKDDRVSSIIVAGPHADEAFADFSMRHADRLGMLGATLVRGGKTHRYETVKAALAHVPEDATHVAVHDAARPAARPELIDRVFDTAERHGAVIPVIAAPDTVKRVGEEIADDAGADPLAAILGAGGKKSVIRQVSETLDRRGLVLAQTPQVFTRELLLRAYAQDDLTSTDDASLVERLGEPVVTVEGDPRNVKITTPADVPLVRAILGFRPPAERATHKKF
ncbi:MAG: 2-C-methyl-D-erythritol 4-phosphate cytidylyltransferase [Phycisphaerales bacterium]